MLLDIPIRKFANQVNNYLLEYIFSSKNSSLNWKSNKLFNPIHSWFIQKILSEVDNYNLDDITELVNMYLKPINSVELILNSYSPKRISVLIEEVNFVFKCSIYKSIFIEQVVYPNGLIAKENNSKISKEINILKDALAILELTKTFSNRALKEYISEIYVIATNVKDIEISSSPKNLYGTFIMCANDPILTAESIVHETCHNILEVYNDQYQLFNNTTKCIYTSAWRADLRPVQGIYHAIYVFYHICKFYRDLIIHINSNSIDYEFLSSNCRNYFDYIKFNEAKILESIDRIFEDKNVTMLGKNLLRKIKTLIIKNKNDLYLNEY